MARVEKFGEFSAYETKNGIRFMKVNKLTSEKNIPSEVVDFLKNKLKGERGQVQKFPRPSEEELAKMRAESMEVKPELQRSDEEMEQARDALTPDDFDDTPLTDEPLDPPLDSNGNEPLPRTDEPAQPTVSSDFLESVSIHTASLEDIAQALHSRFGLYTVYLNKFPEGDEINPLTGEGFNKYHLGIAYQAAIRAQSSGLLQKDHEYNRKAIDQGREAHENLEAQFDAVPQTMGEARRANSFDFRTSVRGNQTTPQTTIEHIRGEDGVYHAIQRPLTPAELENWTSNGATSVRHPEEDEPLVQPGIGKRVIRPDW